MGMKGEGLVLVTREESVISPIPCYIELAEQSIEHAVVTMATSDRPQLMLAGEALAARKPETGGIEEQYLTVEALLGYAAGLSCGDGIGSRKCAADRAAGH